MSTRKMYRDDWYDRKPDQKAVLDILLIGPENLSAPDDVPQALESSCVIEDFNVLFSRRELVVC